jgi:hypothetical protein
MNGALQAWQRIRESEGIPSEPVEGLGQPRAVWLGRVLALLDRLGIGGVSVSSRAATVEVHIPSVEHSHGPSAPANVCPLCLEREGAREALARIILRAFPDLVEAGGRTDDPCESGLRIVLPDSSPE